jgi:hypothetical protein
MDPSVFSGKTGGKIPVFPEDLFWRQCLRHYEITLTVHKLKTASLPCGSKPESIEDYGSAVTAHVLLLLLLQCAVIREVQKSEDVSLLRERQYPLSLMM